MDYLDYIYEIDECYINTYGIVKKDEYYKEFINHYNYYMMGERMIEKLVGRGYISYDEALEKYNVSKIKTIEKEKTKRLFKRK